MTIVSDGAQTPYDREIPGAIVDLAEDANGYMQVTIAPDGTVHVRGSRHAVARFVAELREHGLHIQFQTLHWCG